MVTTARPTVLHTVLVLTHSLAASFLPLDFCNTLNKLFFKPQFLDFLSSRDLFTVLHSFGEQAFSSAADT